MALPSALRHLHHHLSIIILQTGKFELSDRSSVGCVGGRPLKRKKVTGASSVAISKLAVNIKSSLLKEGNVEQGAE
jgi:hypothetical protein